MNTNHLVWSLAVGRLLSGLFPEESTGFAVSSYVPTLLIYLYTNALMYLYRCFLFQVFFVMLFLLGIDSAFSFMEGFLTVMKDTKLFCNVSRKKLSFVCALCAFLLSLIYATDAGLNFLDTIDYYINFVMLLVGGFECFAAGWVYGLEEQIDDLGKFGIL